MDTKDLTIIDAAPIDRLQRSGMITAVVGLVLGAIGVVMDRSQFGPSWLIGFVFCTGLSLGSLALLMTYHMTGGDWGHVARRCFEAGAGLLPFCALLFIPVAIFVPSLYPWAGPDSSTLSHTKAMYLTQGFFVGRAVIYFAVWTFMATMLRSWSFAQDRGEVAITEADTRRFRVVSAPGLVIYVVLMSLAAIDWVMSLDPHWYSTIFGFIFVAGQALCALSFAVAVLAMLVQREPMNGVLKAGHFHDLGKLMLAFVMLWAYFSFSQFLIIWAGNLPEEITFFLARLQQRLAVRELRDRVRPFHPAVLPAAVGGPEAPAAAARTRRVVHRRDSAGRHHLARGARLQPEGNADFGGKRRHSAAAGGRVGFPVRWTAAQASAGAGERSVTSSACSRMAATGDTEMARALAGKPAQSGHVARDERRQHPRDHLVRRRAGRDGGADRRGDVRHVQGARLVRAQHRGGRVAARAARRHDAARAAAADHALDRSERAARRGIGLPARLRLDRSEGGRRADSDREGEVAAAAARDPRRARAPKIPPKARTPPRSGSRTAAARFRREAACDLP